MGVTVRQKVKGRGKPWWVYIYDPSNGNRKSIKVGPQGAAEELANKIREKMCLGEICLNEPQATITFGEYARKWLDGYVETNLKFTTQKSYDYIIRVHLGRLKDRPLDQIRRPEIRELIYEKLKTDLSPKTVLNIKAVVSSVMNHAFEDGLIIGNPVARLGKFIKRRDPKADINPLTRDEARALLDTLQEHFPRYHSFFLCALRTGMRLGELLALEWGDIDFRGGFIEVRRSFTHGQYTTPKSGKTRRIDVSPQLAETLKALATARKREALAKGRPAADLVFVNEIGGVIHEGNLRNRVFFKALAKAGLRRIRIHDLRHTFASLLIQQGESLAYVKEQMGHHSIQITVDIYGHLVPGANRQAVAKLDDDILQLTASEAGCK
ncbi:MAG: tyrosine-type recombinase/integrase [Desulfobaccales bacterium]